ncbi:hypothetical protein JZK55_17070 [Dissulfurispira thermophila]|uniref:Transmembrane protein n=1 Tax=Dissulfurispira thermophila TaxID=2715679 RepID=A0A7G1H1V4_9BACT|nr:hypothetical protein [Dissulfurispira thermophila]BCB96785.1 hypothetical protein JZK55_17070 [Dissulfurispira thermophila]
MQFDHDEYKQALVKILDASWQSHWYVIHQSVSMIIDVARTYLWTSSAIGAVSVFLIKDIGLMQWSRWALLFAIVFGLASCALSLWVLWGRGYVNSSVLRPINMADFAYEQLMAGKPYHTIYGGLINGISEANETCIQSNRKKVRILRISAPCLFVSFLCLCAAIVARFFNV